MKMETRHGTLPARLETRLRHLAPRMPGATAAVFLLLVPLLPAFADGESEDRFSICNGREGAKSETIEVIAAGKTDTSEKPEKAVRSTKECDSSSSTVLVYDWEDPDSCGQSPGDPPPLSDPAEPPRGAGGDGGSGAGSARIEISGSFDYWPTRPSMARPESFHATVSIKSFLGKTLFATAAVEISCVSSLDEWSEKRTTTIDIGGEPFTTEITSFGMLETWGVECSGLASIGARIAARGPFSLEISAMAGAQGFRGSAGVAAGAGVCLGLEVSSARIALEAGYLASTAGGFRDRISIGLSAGWRF